MMHKAMRIFSKQNLVAAALAATFGIAFGIQTRNSAGVAHAAEQLTELPPPADHKIDFTKEIQPILQASCVQCHANNSAKGKLSIDTREGLLKGGESGPAIEIGKSGDSTLINLVSGIDIDADMIMPKKGNRLSANEISQLRAWIDQGAPWPKGFTLSTFKNAPLEPRRPQVPVIASIDNPIDRILQPYYDENKIAPGDVVSDAVFARRVYLDTIGLLPPPSELEAFEKDRSADKRVKLVNALLNRNEQYAENWMSFWNDLLRNDYKGTGYIDGGRKQITAWLYNALKEDMPFDQFVRELTTGANGSEGFIKGIVWRGVVNAAQSPQMQAAQNISQVFMGINLKCASCHDSFVSTWKLTDSYGLAGVYADGPLEMERCAKPLGQTAPMKFLFPQLGAVDATAPRDKRLEQLAAAITSEKDGRLTRTMVNRLWQRLVGRGIIEAVDDMDRKPWNQDLLDWLAVDLVDQKYDLKKTMARIMTSRAYQLPAIVESQERNEQYVFKGPNVRRMTAEQFADAVATVTGSWPKRMDAALSTTAARFSKSRWIWSDKNAATSTAPATVYFRRQFKAQAKPSSADAIITCDNEFKLYINGKLAASGDNWMEPVKKDLKEFIHDGQNVVTVVATNNTDKPSPAGFWFNMEVKYGESFDAKTPTLVGTGNNWRMSKTAPPKEWDTAEFSDEKWPKAIALGDPSIGPWLLASKLPGDDPGDHPQEIRTVFCVANSLTTTLGRPNREQVVTERPNGLTTLQALELTNGPILAGMLRSGAENYAKETDSAKLVNEIFMKAYGRTASEDESKMACDLIQSSATRENGVEDLLWTVVNLPEFQLIQ
jgi:mono/diheme cytochrome c family protein